MTVPETLPSVLTLWFCASALGLMAPSAAQPPPDDLSRQRIALPETPAQKEARLRWWREARFGMFIHWGPVTLRGTEITWSRGAQVPVEEYDSLYLEFNPVRFNAKEWVATAKAAGMKYIIFVAKHWDGFCEWPTATTPYSIAATPFRRDVCGELAREAHKAGIRIGWYFCPADQHDPDCLTERNDRYLQRMRGQLTELLSNYGEISLLWFDFAAPPEGKPWDQENTYALVRRLQPNIIIDNRLDMGVMADYHAQRVGPNADYYTPEQRVGGYDDTTPWETCMTIGTQWSHKPNDDVKSVSECIRTLILCAGGDGNLLLNVGPTSLGEIEAPQVERLKAVGAWLKRYGESIYGTRGGPFKPNGLVASTRKGSAIYTHVLRPVAGTLALPPIAAKIKSAVLLGGGKLKCLQTADGITIDFGAAPARPLETVVKLSLDRPAQSIAAVDTPKSAGGLLAGATVTASNVWQDDAATYGAGKAFDGDYDSRWATDSGPAPAWIAVEYPKPVTVSRIAISEGWNRVRAFELQRRDGAEWKTVFAGTTIGESFSKSFPPVTSRAFRLVITETTDGPTIWEILLK